MFDVVNTTMAQLTYSAMPSYTALSSFTVPMMSKDDIATMYLWLFQCLSWSTALKILVFVLVAANFKNFPLVYHLRILNGVRFVLRSQRSSKPLTPDQLFQPLITSSKATLMETDVFGHKSNSTYFSDVDVARVHLLTTLFSKAIENYRGSTTMNGLSGKTSSAFTIPLGGVSCSFRKELKPYETYDMWTRILSWDQKWFYLVTHFVKKGAKIEPREYTMYPRQMSTSSSASSRKGSMASVERRESKDSTGGIAQPAIAASAMSKIVFKNGRITLAPEVMLELAGLLPPKEKNPVAHREELKEAQIEANAKDNPAANPTELLPDLDTSDSDSGYESPRRNSEDNASQSWTRERIEAERQRGMKMASLLAKQTALEDEFSDEAALGRHYDGHGVEGVVSTLAQLGKLSRYQLL